MQKTIFTQSKARLQLLQANNDQPYNWLFLPGGPGLGSESLVGLTSILQLPGSLWLVDFPGDGSNSSNDPDMHFSHWQTALIEVAQALDHIILAAHSSGGMFALATAELENHLSGLILMDSAPNAGWQTAFMSHVQTHPILELDSLQTLYNAHPSNELLKQLTIASIPYFSTPRSLNALHNLLKTLPFNYISHQWAEKHFDQTYQATWVPQKIPTLIFAGDHDPITPLSLFTTASEFHRDNVIIRSIENASHFPWYDNPEQVQQLFAEFITRL